MICIATKFSLICSVYHEIIVTGFIPFLALVVCNIRIYCKIRESSKHEKHRSVRYMGHDIVHFLILLLSGCANF